MASIRVRKREDGKEIYYVRIRLKGTGTQCSHFERKTDAMKWIESVKSAIREGRDLATTAGRRRTLADGIKRYRRDVLPGKAPSTGVTQDQHLRWWESQLGNKRIGSITVADVAEARDELQAAGLGNSTVVHYLSTLSHLFSKAIREWKWCQRNPVRDTDKPPEPEGRTRFLSQDELKRFLEAIQQSDCAGFRAAVLLALATGMRRGEQLALTWDRLDLESGRVTLIASTTKTKRTRTVPLTGAALAALREHAKVRRLDSNRVFPSKDGRRGFDFRRAFTAALKKAGITDFHWHDLRHTAASYMVMNGASLSVVAKLLGHQNIETTQRYSHLTDDYLRAEVEKMNAAILGGK